MKENLCGDAALPYNAHCRHVCINLISCVLYTDFDSLYTVYSILVQRKIWIVCIRLLWLHSIPKACVHIKTLKKFDRNKYLLGAFRRDRGTNVARAYFGFSLPSSLRRRRRCRHRLYALAHAHFCFICMPFLSGKGELKAKLNELNDETKYVPFNEWSLIEHTSRSSFVSFVFFLIPAPHGWLIRKRININWLHWKRSTSARVAYFSRVLLHLHVEAILEIWLRKDEAKKKKRKYKSDWGKSYRRMTNMQLISRCAGSYEVAKEFR